ncbi:MAG: class II aldolase/adducin family protein [Saprospiraceae bacterium]|nr:class II aldolase/adducin family protein [Saprospiraceae bacterium]
MPPRDEGYLKFQAIWTETPPFPESKISNLNHWRSVIYKLGLIGAYESGIGFGNISQRLDAAGQFIISGTATGGIPKLTGAHYALVQRADPAQNKLYCKGPVIASSESMSHAVIYRECPEINGVIHIHHLNLWKKLLHRVPTTDRSATYGTPEMAASIVALLQETALPELRIFVMEGHEEGIFAFGETLESAVSVILEHLGEWLGLSAYNQTLP